MHYTTLAVTKIYRFSSSIDRRYVKDHSIYMYMQFQFRQNNYIC